MRMFINAGFRVRHKDQGRPQKRYLIYDKPARRMIRKRAFEGTMGMKLRKLRTEAIELSR